MIAFVTVKDGKEIYDISDETFRNIVSRFKPEATEEDFDEIKGYLLRDLQRKKSEKDGI